jgi:hypothetical protein
MTFARIRLVVAAALFFGWLAWLGTAVLQRGSVPLVSRAQVTGATHVVVAAVKVGANGLPEPTAEVVEGLRGGMVPGAVEVTNLPAAMPPGAGGFPGAGTYLLPLVTSGDGKYKVAGLPRSPGYEPATPERPVIYPWTDDVKKQMAKVLP